MQQNTQIVARESKDDKEEQIIIRNTGRNQFVANKNFINQNSVWVDADYSETAQVTEVSVKFASDEYFKLLQKERGLAPYLALGEQVIVLWKGRVYKITK